MQQVLVQFGPFLNRNHDLAPSLREKLLDIINNAHSLSLLKIVGCCQGAFCGIHFFYLEGDGYLVMNARGKS